MYRGWTPTDYQNKHYNINQKDEGTLDDRGRDGGTNFILRIKEQETRLTLQERDGDDDDALQGLFCFVKAPCFKMNTSILLLSSPHNSHNEHALYSFPNIETKKKFRSK